MRTTLSLRRALVGLALLSTLLCGSARADVFPVVTNPASTEFVGGVVFDGTNYMVGMVSGTNLIAQRLSPSGQLLGTPTIVGSNPGFPPAVALASAQTNCLLAWTDLSLTSGVTIYGQLLSPSSGPVGSRFPLLASAGSHQTQIAKAAASDGTNFLVVWQDAVNTQFYGQLVTPTGSLLGSEQLLFSLPAENGNKDLALAFGKTNYLLAWQNGTNNSNHTFGQLISTQGQPGPTFQISPQPSLDHNPLAIAFDGTNFLVTWNHHRVYATGQPEEWNLLGRLVAPNRTMAPNAMVLADETASFPALAFDGANYLLAWGCNPATSGTNPPTIHARYFTPSGNPFGATFTPFPQQGTNPPLLPLNGLLFDGKGFFLAATMGSFVMEENGDVIGFAGGDAWCTFIPRSTRLPVFEQPAVVDGHFQTQLRVVPGQTYTIEISTNLLSWQPVDRISSDTGDIIPMHDDEEVGTHLFCRVALGDQMPVSYELHFMEFAYGGSFAGDYTPRLSTPISLNSYSAVFDVEYGSDLPPPSNVLFTGPDGSGLSNTAANPDNSHIGETEAFYQSPSIAVPANAPGGTWNINLNGTNMSFEIPDPQANARLTIPLPTVAVTNGILQGLTWGYRNPLNGANLGAPPPYITEVRVEINRTGGERFYDSPGLPPTSTTHTLPTPIAWSEVEGLSIAYDDTLGNHYVIYFAK